jgi:predicted transposase/invertase (TIGR01784 family)
MAVETLGTFTQSELDYIRESGRIKAELDYKADMREAKLRSHAEGLAEGRNKASFDIARNLKGMGLPISQIAEGTGLSIETITQL